MHEILNFILVNIYHCFFLYSSLCVAFLSIRVFTYHRYRVDLRVLADTLFTLVENNSLHIVPFIYILTFGELSLNYCCLWKKGICQEKYGQ